LISYVTEKARGALGDPLWGSGLKVYRIRGNNDKCWGLYWYILQNVF